MIELEINMLHHCWNGELYLNIQQVYTNIQFQSLSSFWKSKYIN